MKLVLLLISTSAASALWTGSRRLRAVSGASPGGPLNLANSHPLAIPRGGQLGDSLAHECGEAAAYGFVYAIAAALTGGVAERVFPDYNEKKNAFLLTLEIALQAAFNAAVAQLVRAAVAQLRFIAGISDEFCVDALGGGSFGPGGDIGLYKCKRGDKNSEWSHTSEQAITLRSKFDGQTLCMTNTGKYVKGETACSSNSDSGLPWMAQWNFLPVG